MSFCKQANIDSLEQITPTFLREYLESLDHDGLTVITRHGHYAALKTFLRWFEAKEEPPNWSNPIAKIKPPKMPDEPIQPIPMPEVKKIIAKCPSDLRGLRDKAILLTLLDTGIHASELLQLDQSNLTLTQGSLLIRHGKGNKTRTVFIGKSTRKLIKRYLTLR
jgi:site-specific recombinase XerD